MNCEDARAGLPAFVRGRIGLTEWALLEAHVEQCAACQQAEAYLRQQAAAARPVTGPRAVPASLRKAMELARIGVPGSTALDAGRRALLTAAARDLTPRATAGLRRAIGLAIGYSADVIARIRVSLATTHALAARTFASASQALGRGITRSRGSLAIPLRSSVAVANALEVVGLGITRSVKRTIRSRPSVQAAGVVLTLAFAVYALQRTDGPQQLASPPASPGPLPTVESARPEPAPLELTPAGPALDVPAPLGPSRPAPSGEEKTISGAPPRADERRQAPAGVPPRAAALSPPDVSASGPVEVASSPPTLLSELPVSATHVVGRLSPKNPRAAQRDLIALLANVGVTELGRSHRVTFTAIVVIVPQSRYDEFGGGLARTGSWRLAAARLPLPDAVHMTIRMGE
jgi:hypothetical protein